MHHAEGQAAIALQLIAKMARGAPCDSVDSGVKAHAAFSLRVGRK